MRHRRCLGIGELPPPNHRFARSNAEAPGSTQTQYQTCRPALRQSTFEEGRADALSSDGCQADHRRKAAAVACRLDRDQRNGLARRECPNRRSIGPTLLRGPPEESVQQPASCEGVPGNAQDSLTASLPANSMTSWTLSPCRLPRCRCLKSDLSLFVLTRRVPRACRSLADDSESTARPDTSGQTATSWSEQRRVQHNGIIRWRGQRVFISSCLAGELVGLREQDYEQWWVYFGSIKLGLLDEKRKP